VDVTIILTPFVGDPDVYVSVAPNTRPTKAVHPLPTRSLFLLLLLLTRLLCSVSSYLLVLCVLLLLLCCYCAAIVLLLCCYCAATVQQICLLLLLVLLLLLLSLFTYLFSCVCACACACACVCVCAILQHGEYQWFSSSTTNDFVTIQNAMQYCQMANSTVNGMCYFYIGIFGGWAAAHTRLHCTCMRTLCANMHTHCSEKY
jgi:hypothetical protein